jgi:ubiquinone/menaquinone biosynthesis C-methylase UbiE
MTSRPDYLGEQFAARFQDQSVVDRYHLRPTYPPETFRFLADLIVDEPHTILDAGCGTGEIARHLLDYAERIDAVDISLPMLVKGRAMPGGDSHKIRWLYGKIEEIPLSPPYALITTGQSLHWMEWDMVMPRFRQVLTPHGYLAILDVDATPSPWDESLHEITRRYSTNQAYQPFDLIEELEKRHLFHKEGEKLSTPATLEQSIQDRIEAMHAQSSLSRDAMTAEMADAFAQEIEALLSPYAQNGKIIMQVVGQIVWGKPLSLGDNPL